MINKNILLHLSLIDSIGHAAVSVILNKIDKNYDLKNIYEFSLYDFQRNFNFSEKLSKKIFDGLQNKHSLEQELKLIENNKICWSTFIDDEYPELLKNIHSPPIVIYWQGKQIDNNQKHIAIIGARKADSYANNVINNLVQPLVANEWVIVSGGALGADTMAHQAALECKGRTVAILGSGLLKPYPALNKRLFQKILENNGTVLSSFPLNFPPLAQNFPARNRIISGISKGCVVTQAAIKSGTRITALHALEQGRDVFAVPGSIENELSAGCNKLIQEGAKLITCAEDILNEYGETYIKKIVVKESKNVLTAQDEIVLLCKMPTTIEELNEKTNLELDKLQNLLFELQLEGRIIQNFAGLWQSF